MTDAPVLELENISRSFRRKGGLFATPELVRAVRNVSFTLRRGETLGLVGESGSGKSTLARVVARLLNPDGGRILLHGRDIHSPGAFSVADRSFSRHIQMVFQDPYSSLNPRLTIGESVAEPLLCAGKNKTERENGVSSMLDMVGLGRENARRYPHEFSGGQRQRVALARALALRPEILLCDEPVSALDASVQAQVLNLLKDLQDGLGLSMLFISHDLAVISHMSDRVAVMYMGRLVELAPASEFFAGPLHPYSRFLLAAASGLKDAETMQPRPGTASAACPYYRLCPEAEKPCAEKTPPDVQLNPEHMVKCFAAPGGLNFSSRQPGARPDPARPAL